MEFFVFYAEIERKSAKIPDMNFEMYAKSEKDIIDKIKRKESKKL
jgi:hypothetical protein